MATSGADDSDTHPISDAKLSSGNSTSKAQEKKHNLRISGFPAINLNASAPLIGTPYTTCHAPPFEYPFPTPNSSVGTPYAMYATAMHSPFPFAPSLLAPGQSYSYPFSGSNPLTGSRVPLLNRGAISTTNRPPVPPSLKQKAKAKAQASQAAISEENTPPNPKTS